MSKAVDFDLTAAHRHFAAHCFNAAWELMEKPDRSPEEDRLMVALNQASIYHWLNRPDCEPRRLSVGYWQASRIQALLGNATEARRHAEVCLAYGDGQDAFYLGYAHEALARAARVAGDAAVMRRHLELAAGHAAHVAKAEERELLQKDLTELGG